MTGGDFAIPRDLALMGAGGLNELGPVRLRQVI